MVSSLIIVGLESSSKDPLTSWRSSLRLEFSLSTPFIASMRGVPVSSHFFSSLLKFLKNTRTFSSVNPRCPDKSWRPSAVRYLPFDKYHSTITILADLVIVVRLRIRLAFGSNAELGGSDEFEWSGDVWDPNGGLLGKFKGGTVIGWLACTDANGGGGGAVVANLKNDSSDRFGGRGISAEFWTSLSEVLLRLLRKVTLLSSGFSRAAVMLLSCRKQKTDFNFETISFFSLRVLILLTEQHEATEISIH